jgi:hypothetical protein
LFLAIVTVAESMTDLPVATVESESQLCHASPHRQRFAKSEFSLELESFMRWFVIGLLFALLPACGGDTGSDRAPQRTAGELATIRAEAGVIEPTPTERRATATPTAPPATATASEDSAPVFVSDPRLAPALLERSDLPTNWTLGRSDGLSIASFCSAVPIEEQFSAPALAYASYSAASGEWAEQWVVQLTESDAIAAMEYARTAMTCDTDKWPLENGDVLNWEFSPLETMPMGDEVYARSFGMRYDNPVYTPMVGNLYFARQGDLVMILAHYGFYVDSATSQRIAEAAVSRLGNVRDGGV